MAAMADPSLWTDFGCDLKAEIEIKHSCGAFTY